MLSCSSEMVERAGTDEEVTGVIRSDLFRGRNVLGPRGLRFRGEHLADSANGVTLVVVQGQELEAVVQPLAVTHNGSHLERVRAERQGNFEGHDFAGFEISGEGSADAVLAEFGGASPAIAEFAILKHADLHADVDGEARVAASVRGAGLSKSGR